MGVLLSVLLVVVGLTGGLAAKEKPAGAGDQAAIERARKSVHMLDGIYKSAIVLITDKYLRDKKSYPAGRAAVAWFKTISKMGGHEVRILDASGEPYNEANVAKDEFDSEGIRQLKAGKGYYDQVVREGSKTYLRAITPIPVVMDKCIMCHANYKSAKKNEPVGALTYKMPID
jgi:hypothetical protein